MPFRMRSRAVRSLGHTVRFRVVVSLAMPFPTKYPDSSDRVVPAKIYPSFNHLHPVHRTRERGMLREVTLLAQDAQ